MKFSTQTLQTIRTILTEEFRQELANEAPRPQEIEQALRSGLQEWDRRVSAKCSVCSTSKLTTAKKSVPASKRANGYPGAQRRS